MQCGAILASGQRCLREAEGDSRVCSFHQEVERRREGRVFYTSRLSPEDQEALAMAAQLQGLDAEVAILRVLIRQLVSVGDVNAARRGIDSLCRTFKVRHQLDDGSTERLAESLERVLDSLGQELEVPL